MSWIFIFIVVLGLMVLALILAELYLKKDNTYSDHPYLKKENTYTDYPYQNAGALFTPAERSFFGVLNQAVGKSAQIFGKVRVADVVVPRKGPSRSDWQKAFNKISAKHFDFLLCRNDDLSVICAIEVDDSSHNSKKRQQRDEFLRGVCNASELPLIQMPAKVGYVIDEVKQVLAPYLNVIKSPDQDETVVAQESIEKEKTCIKCSSSMVIRVAQKGNNAGKQFWACNAYPKCKHTEAIQA
jgi:ssDNA-binding Zn-finger/Zn-ribbon topoisomerase 1